MTTIRTSIIVALSDNNVIGIKNDLPWYIPEDLKRFKSITFGKPCIMGRKTFESIVKRLGKPLPGRTSIVVSRSGYAHDGAIICPSLEAALIKARTIAVDNEASEIMVIGGAQIYEQALPLADRLYLTRVHQKIEGGDAFFPPVNEQDWETAVWEDFDGYTFLTLDR